MKVKFKKWLATSVSVLMMCAMMSGCTDGSFASDGDDSDVGYSSAKGINGSQTFIGSNGTGEDAKNANTYYFAYDNSELSPEAKTEVGKHAKYLLEHPSVKVRIEGHTDERGSREYNVALGERRAQSVSGALAADGVLGNQVAVVSYGEEKPAVQGHDESAWQWNRRAKLVYEQG